MKSEKKKTVKRVSKTADNCFFGKYFEDHHQTYYFKCNAQGKIKEKTKHEVYVISGQGKFVLLGKNIFDEDGRVHGGRSPFEGFPAS